MQLRKKIQICKQQNSFYFPSLFILSKTKDKVPEAASTIIIQSIQKGTLY